MDLWGLRVLDLREIVSQSYVVSNYWDFRTKFVLLLDRLFSLVFIIFIKCYCCSHENDKVGYL